MIFLRFFGKVSQIWAEKQHVRPSVIDFKNDDKYFSITCNQLFYTWCSRFNSYRTRNEIANENCSDLKASLNYDIFLRYGDKSKYTKDMVSLSFFLLKKLPEIISRSRKVFAMGHWFGRIHWNWVMDKTTLLLSKNLACTSDLFIKTSMLFFIIPLAILKVQKKTKHSIKAHV